MCRQTERRWVTGMSGGVGRGLESELVGGMSVSRFGVEECRLLSREHCHPLLMDALSIDSARLSITQTASGLERVGGAGFSS